MKEWSIYMIRCDGGALYTGITTDVARRLGEHISGNGKASKYMRSFSSKILVYEVLIGDKIQALIIERKIKKLPKREKEVIILKSFNREGLLCFIAGQQHIKKGLV